MNKKPSWYFPIESGKYEVKPGLTRLDLQKDSALEFDSDYYKFRKNILQQQSPTLKSESFQRKNFTAEPEVCDWLCSHLSNYHPDLFEYKKFIIPGKRILDCFLTGERLVFNSSMKLIDVHVQLSHQKNYKNIYDGSFDAITSQIQEDVCVLQKKNKDHWISAISLFCSNGWTAKEKIGGTFNSVHEPVAMFEKISSNQDKMVDFMINAKQPFVRFAWGLHNNSYLNRKDDNNYWSKAEDLYLRIERQLIFGLGKEINASIFSIRTYQKSIEDLLKDNPEQFFKLKNAIKTMPEEAQKYKGLWGEIDKILDNFSNLEQYSS